MFKALIERLRNTDELFNSAKHQIAELEENIAAVTEEGKVDEGVLQRCLELAQSPQGKERLRELVGQGEMARTRAYIRGYAQRALAEAG
jgi:hypothetical protein